MPKEDLLEHAKSSEDFYGLLGVTFETSESDIRRAYRKTALKYHPDKLGAAFDPEKFHLLQIAYDVLSDAAAKAVYDQGRLAKRQKEFKDAAFEGKRRAMKEELEARERKGMTAFGPTPGGMKRERDENEETINLSAIREAGKRRRLAEEEKRRVAGLGTPERVVATSAAPSTTVPHSQTTTATTTQTAAEEAAEEDEIARLERRIKEAEEAKARRKAEKKARKSGIFVPTDSPASGRHTSNVGDRSKRMEEAHTPAKAPDRFSSLKADLKTSATPKLTFASSPQVTPAKAGDNTGFAATMQRLKDAERKRLEEEIRKQDAAENLP